jgi:hypothetical protein
MRIVLFIKKFQKFISGEPEAISKIATVRFWTIPWGAFSQILTEKK